MSKHHRDLLGLPRATPQAEPAPAEPAPMSQAESEAHELFSQGQIDLQQRDSRITQARRDEG